jgi:transposase
MRKLREVLRLIHEAGLGQRQVARSLKLSPSTVAEYRRRAVLAGLSWPLPEGLDDAGLEQRVFPPADSRRAGQRPLPVWAEVHAELKRRNGVTLALLWEEYKATHPDGLQYSRFCDHYRAWAGRVDVVMRQSHRAGEKLFVDWAGQTVPVVNRTTGEVRPAQVFVAVLGASSYTYAEATWTQSLPDWIGAHTRALEFLGGAPEILVPDNPRTGIDRACRYDPDVNATYAEWAAHYGVAVIPARVRKPRDKAKVEAGVLMVERWVLAALRNRTFFSLAELNAAIRTLIERINQRSFKKLPGSRASLFEALDRPALRPLPAARYVFGEWSRVRVHIDYHVEVDHHYYSVPYPLVGKQLEARASAHTVELFHQGVRVASHLRSHARGRHTTLPEHMPEAHRRYAEWTPERLVRWAGKTGPATARAAEAILGSRPHPEQGFRACQGLIRLGKSYGPARLEAACARALATGPVSYRRVADILKAGLDRQPTPTTEATAPGFAHDNLRGPAYYH